MKVFAHYYPYPPRETGNHYRWRTLLQFGSSWDVIGTVVMKNPGISRPICSVNKSDTLDRLKKFSLGCSEYEWCLFSIDDTMRNVERLFCTYYKTSVLNGVIQIFNLMNVRDPNIEQALAKNKKATFPLAKTTESDIQQLVAPVYLGWGNLAFNPSFREDVEKIFHVVTEQLDGKYLFPQLNDNKFYHPQWLMGVGRNHPQCQYALNAFCQNTTMPKLDVSVISPKPISKTKILEQVVRRLRQVFAIVEEQPKTYRFQLTDEFVLTITCTAQGYVGIRHSSYSEKYTLNNYPHIKEYRTILSDLGYNTTNEVWLGVKNFKEYGSDNDSISHNIINETLQLWNK